MMWVIVAGADIPRRCAAAHRHAHVSPVAARTRTNREKLAFAVSEPTIAFRTKMSPVWLVRAASIVISMAFGKCDSAEFALACTIGLEFSCMRVTVSKLLLFSLPVSKCDTTSDALTASLARTNAADELDVICVGALERAVSIVSS